MPSSHLIPCCPFLLPPSTSPSIRVFSNESALHIRWPKYWSFGFNISPSNEHSGLISFRMDWSCCPGDSQESYPTPEFKSINSLVPSFLYSPTLTSICDYWKNHSFARWTFAGKVMSLIFNMLSRLVTTFLPRRKHLLISWLQSPSVVILEPPKIKSPTVSTVCPSIYHEGMRLDAMILVFWMLGFKPGFSLSSFTFIKRLFSSSSLSAIRVMSSAYLRLLICLLAILIPACASSSLVFLMMFSAYELNKHGDNIQLWHAPFPVWNQSIVPCPVLLLLELHTDFSKGRSGGLVFPSLSIVIHRVKGFGIVNKAETDVFLELSCLFDNPVDVWSLVPLPFLNPAWTSGSCTVEAWLGEFWALLY